MFFRKLPLAQSLDPKSSDHSTIQIAMTLPQSGHAECESLSVWLQPLDSPILVTVPLSPSGGDNINR